MKGKLEPDGRGGYTIRSESEVQDDQRSANGCVSAIIVATLSCLGTFLILGDLDSPVKKLILLAAMVGGMFVGWRLWHLVQKVLILGILLAIVGIVGLVLSWWIRM